MTKLIIGFERKPELTSEQCHKHLQEVHGPLVTSVPEFRNYLKGYIQNLAVDPPGEQHGLFSNLDAVVSLWFENVDQLVKAYSEPKYLDLIRPDEPRFANLNTLIVSRVSEEVVWDDGDSGTLKYIRFLPSGGCFDQSRPEFTEVNGDIRRHIKKYVRNWPDGSAVDIFPSMLEVHCVEEFWIPQNISPLQLSMLAIPVWLSGTHSATEKKLRNCPAMYGRENCVIPFGQRAS